MDAIAAGRKAFEKETWSDAFAQLRAADTQTTLEPEDLERLSIAACLLGDDTTGSDALTRAHHGFLARGDSAGAARDAFWLAMILFQQPNQQAQAGGWLARARRLLEEAGRECVEQGLLLYASAVQKVRAGDIAGARAAFADAARIGTKFKDRDLIALARHGEGRALVYLNHPADGFAIIDEVMVSITCGEVGPLATGVVYGSVIGTCRDCFDLRRAQEWISAMTRWCDAHPDMVLFHGECLVHRAELLQLHGSWSASLEQAVRACEKLHDPTDPAIAGAHYQKADLHRLRGEFDDAESSYRRASQAGRKPQPGLALLRLAQGDADAADVAIRRALEETSGPRLRAHMLRASVEVALARRDLAAARNDADGLAHIADTLAAPFVRAAAAYASGAVALASGETALAVGMLREACALWQEVDAPYEIAKTRVLMGRAYRALGDEDGAELEWEAAHETFERLGATPDMRHVDALLPPRSAAASGALTGREVEVLRLVATGKTNRMIATELNISEKTVARHLSNIFIKLDLTSRSAATAYAYEHKLV